MKSNLKGTKYYFEKLFQDEWTNTPIHFAGQEFDSTGRDTWVNPRFVPQGGSLNSFGMRTKLYGAVDVVCWAKNDVEVFDLVDNVVEFMSAHGKDYAIHKFEVNDHGWDDSNMVYVYLTFNLTYYEGECQATAPTTYNTITYHGKNVTHNGIILTH